MNAAIRSLELGRLRCRRLDELNIARQIRFERHFDGVDADEQR